MTNEKNQFVAGRCHLCGAAAVEFIPEFGGFRRVTSDCQPWPAGGRLGVCRECDTVQTATDAAWQAEIAEIYAQYSIYHQSGGVEQSVFAHDSSQPSARSSRIIEYLSRGPRLPQRGRMLDVGCGNGEFLRAFAETFPAWSLVGSELNDKYRSVVEAIPGVEALCVGNPEDAPGQFDLVVMVHVLEHIPDPGSFLRRLAGKLAAAGVIVLEVPDYGRNPFDLLVANHCTHFSQATLSRLVMAAGYGVHSAATDWIPREISLVAGKSAEAAGPQDPLVETAARPPCAAWSTVRGCLAWLAAVLDHARELAGRGPLGLFGTSIAATWLVGELGPRVSFLVDEDPRRTGRQFMGLPVLAPAHAPAGSDVLISLPIDVAEKIHKRLGGHHVPMVGGLSARFHVPPPTMGTWCLNQAGKLLTQTANCNAATGPVPNGTRLRRK